MGDDDENDTIRRILRDIKKTGQEKYPEPLLKNRRETFLRWLFSRRFGCFIFWIVILGIILIWLLNNF